MIKACIRHPSQNSSNCVGQRPCSPKVPLALFFPSSSSFFQFSFVCCCFFVLLFFSITRCLLACLYCGAYYAGSEHEHQRKAVLSIASLAWRRLTPRRCLCSLRFFLRTKRVHPAAPTKRFGDLQTRIPTFIFFLILVAEIRWRDPVWPSGKALGCKHEDLGSIRFGSPFSSLQKIVVYGHCLVTLPTQLMEH